MQTGEENAVNKELSEISMTVRKPTSTEHLCVVLPDVCQLTSFKDCVEVDLEGWRQQTLM